VGSSGGRVVVSEIILGHSWQKFDASMVFDGPNKTCMIFYSPPDATKPINTDIDRHCDETIRTCETRC
jgi:hypothetical protein